MPTTARGIWTPSDTDAVDFTTHLATMAGTIDTAITNGLNTVGTGANAYKGTAAQRAAFLSTAVAGMLWQDTDDIKMIWRKDGAVWVPAVWRWSGTTAQMNAFTQAPNGFEWFNTTDSKDYVRLGGAWGLSGLAPATITTPSAGGIVLKSGWTAITNTYWGGVKFTKATPSLARISGAISNPSAVAALTPVATMPVAPRHPEFIPAMIGATPNYAVILTNGDLVFAGSISASLQASFGGEYMMLP